MRVSEMLSEIIPLEEPENLFLNRFRSAVNPKCCGRGRQLATKAWVLQRHISGP